MFPFRHSFLSQVIRIVFVYKYSCISGFNYAFQQISNALSTTDRSSFILNPAMLNVDLLQELCPAP